MDERGSEKYRERFTARLEAFSDLVFGFSLSLLATKLDVPTRVEEVFDTTRWAAIVGTFALVCRFWLEHYRIFRHHFVAGSFDAIVNFVFLFAIAIMPYSVQTFLRFSFSIPSFTLYLGDSCLILLTLATLRLRSLQQRRDDPDVLDRLRGWRRCVAQFAVGAALALLALGLNHHGGSIQTALRDLAPFLLGGLAIFVVLTRIFLRRLPAFLV